MDNYYEISNNDIILKIFKGNKSLIFYFVDTDTRNIENEIIIQLTNNKEFRLLATEDNNWNKKITKYKTMEEALIAAGVPQNMLETPLELYNKFLNVPDLKNNTRAGGSLLLSKRNLRREALYGNVKVSQNKFSKSKRKRKSKSKRKRKSKSKRKSKLFLYTTIAQGYYSKKLKSNKLNKKENKEFYD